MRLKLCVSAQRDSGNSKELADLLVGKAQRMRRCECGRFDFFVAFGLFGSSKLGFNKGTFTSGCRCFRMSQSMSHKRLGKRLEKFGECTEC